MSPIDNVDFFTDYILEEELTAEEVEFVLQKMVTILTVLSIRFNNTPAVRNMLLNAFDMSVKHVESQRLRMH